MNFHRVMYSGPMEQAIRELWKAHQDKSAHSLKNLWNRWKLHQEFDLTKPDPKSWGFQFPKGQVPDCMSCINKCCHGSTNTVLLRLIDIALFIDKGWTDKFTLQKPTFTKELLRQRPRLAEMTRSFHWKVFPVLIQKQEQQCIFLSEQGLCSIHDSRPWACRGFPYNLDLEQEEFFWSHRCQTYEQKEAPNKLSKELQHAAFHNFYTEKIRDLVLLKVYSKELKKLGITKWLCLDALKMLK